MRYAVLQLDLAPLPLEALKKAFALTQGLRPQDAALAARDACGVVAQRLSQQDAATVSGVLNGLSIATEVVGEDQMPNLPKGRLINRIDCTEAGMVLYDVLGRQRMVEWGDVDLISAGQVSLTDLVSQSPQYFQVQAGDNYARVRSNSRYTEQTRQHMLIDLLLPGPERFSADAAKLNYEALGTERQPTAAANFYMLVTDLISHATNAALNQGAMAIRDGTEFVYTSRKAFEQETAWQMWKAARNAQG